MIPDQASLSLFLFGAPRLERNGRLMPINRRKLIALLAYLAVTNQTHTRDTLATLFWPNSEPQRAYGSLRRCLSLAKEAVDADNLRITHQLVGWQPEAPLWLDVAEFRRCLDAVKSHQHASDVLCADCLRQLARAADLYQADFLAGFSLPDTPQFDDWQFWQAQTLHHDYAWMLSQLVAHHASQSQTDTALDYAHRWVNADPLHEPAQQQLIQLFAATGQHAAALRQYEQFAYTLQKESDATPQPATTQLYRQLQTPVPRTSSRLVLLPTPLTPFIGQADALAQVLDKLNRADCRLLTITGMGGAGKTRTAVEAAHLCKEQFADGVTFVALATVKTAASALKAIAEATDCPLHADLPLQQQLHEHLRPRHLLLLLDNLEQLAGDVAWLEQFLLAAPAVVCLATSRVPLRLPGEWTVALTGMPYPATAGMEDAAEHEAVQFFAHCARRVQPRFSLTKNLPAVVRICQLVAGLPLALELAAAWTCALSCAQIAAELEQGYGCLARTAVVTGCDDDGRHHSIHNALAWSWSLLSPTAQMALAQLAVIRGQFTLAAAQAITQAPPLTLASLVEHSLITAVDMENGRYALHELTRWFAATRLDEYPGAAQQAQERHCAWYLTLLQQQTANLSGGGQEAAMLVLADELDNIRNAWQWAASQRNWAALAGALHPLFLFYKIRGSFAEGAADFHLALIRHQEGTPIYDEDLFLRLQARLAFFYQHLNQLAEAESLLQENLAFYQGENCTEETAFIHNTLGHIAWRQGKPNKAASHYRSSLRICGQIKAPQTRADALCGLSKSLFDLGQPTAAAFYAEKSLQLRREMQDSWGVATGLNNLSHIAEAQGHYAQAATLLYEAMVTAHLVGARWLGGILQHNIAYIERIGTNA